MDPQEGKHEPILATRIRKERQRNILNLDSSVRLGMAFPTRLLAVSGAAFMAGLGLGSTHGAQMAAFRYRAENAHRFPTDRTGWYLYHKTKNYHRSVGAVKSGLKLGASLGFWGACFIFVEAAVDQARNGTTNVLSDIIAGLSVAGVYSLKNRSDVFTTARLAKTSLKFSLIYGLTQDALSLAKGEPVSYVDSLVSIIRGKSSE